MSLTRGSRQVSPDADFAMTQAPWTAIAAMTAATRTSGHPATFMTFER